MTAKQIMDLYNKTGIIIKDSLSHNRDAFKRNLITLQDEAVSRDEHNVVRSIDDVLAFVNKLENDLS